MNLITEVSVGKELFTGYHIPIQLQGTSLAYAERVAGTSK
jgi:hypothetical protein